MQFFLSLGRLHIPLYGLFVAAGLICAMMLGLRTAAMAKVDRDALWDAGMVTVLAAFVLSRALLVIENIHTFLAYPVLVLELPSLNQGGLLMTAAVALLYLRHRKMPLLGVLDAAAPCAALLQAFMELGLVVDGTREGMPSSLPWAVPSSFGRVHPVEFYMFAGSIALCAVLLRILRHERATGQTAAWGLVLGGLLLFLMDFFRLPQMLYGTSLLDSIQWRGLMSIAIGSLLLAWRLNVSASASSATSPAKAMPQAQDLGNAI